MQTLLLLRCLLLESAALGHLTMTEHAQAQQHILSMRQLHASFPALLPGALHSIHMVTGGRQPGVPLHVRMLPSWDLSSLPCLCFPSLVDFLPQWHMQGPGAHCICIQEPSPELHRCEGKMSRHVHRCREPVHFAGQLRLSRLTQGR